LKGDPRENLIRCMNGWRRISAQLAGAAKDPAALGAPEPSRD
jgi:hypothetical protein